ncbi:MAG: hypothetical protein HY825_01745 [Acidobacteria bacterium]|nr:hypothetical protein [Acidobacteriota bacterium]
MLENLYLDQQLSLTDIARLFSCTRQNVLARMRSHGIDTRSRRDARVLALEQGKLTSEIHKAGGATQSRVLRHWTVNARFFRTWSRGMAWVLGIVCTDGNLYFGRPRTDEHAGSGMRLSIAQKEPELLRKVARLLTCDIPLRHSERSGIRGELYTLQIDDQKICRDLLLLGVHPRKSKTLKFPQVPRQYLRDFIRGCWDGDGTVYTDERGRGYAAFGSASAEFLDAMLANLCQLGMPMPAVHADSRSPDYRYFRYSERDCTRLFHLFYDETENEMFLERKYVVFQAIRDSVSQRGTGEATDV